MALSWSRSLLLGQTSLQVAGVAGLAVVGSARERGALARDGGVGHGLSTPISLELDLDEEL